MTTLREIAKEECLKICNDCEHKNVELRNMIDSVMKKQHNFVYKSQKEGEEDK